MHVSRRQRWCPPLCQLVSPWWSRSVLNLRPAANPKTQASRPPKVYPSIVMQTGVAVGLAFAAVLIVVLINTWYVRRENNKDYSEMELRAPLVEFKKLNREEEAAKAAEQGHTPCHACAFDNFKDAAFCAVCGEALDEAAKRRALKSKVPNTLSARRVRAAKRNEWTRKVDVEGKVFWYRKGTNESTAARFPGYAVTFEHQQQMAIEAGAGKTETLIQETQNATLALVEASKADASAFAFGSKLESVSHEKEVVEQAASLDFPSKYAAFVAKAATALAPTKKQLLSLKVSRKFIVEQALEHLSCVDTKFARAEIAMKFIQKQAGPAADMQRHWFTQLNELVGNPNTGLFTLVDKSNQTFFLNRHSKELVGEDHLTFLYAAGRLLGRGLLEGRLWSFHLSTPLLKIILGQPVSFTDLEFFDPEEYKNLDWLVKNNGAESLNLDFSVTEKVNGEVVVVDLIPNGRNIPVTDANKFEYLERRFKYVLFESVSDQLYAFLKGIYEVVPQEMLMVLDPEELDYVLCGSDVIDVDEWERMSRYNETIHGHPSKKWFWKHTHKMPLEYRRRLLHFTTGNTRVPIGGFAALTNHNGHVAPFTIIGKELVISRAIRAQPCFNQMELPTYVHEKELKANLFGILDNYDYSQ